MDDAARPTDRPPQNVIQFPTRMAKARAASRIAYRRQCEAERGEQPTWRGVLVAFEEAWADEKRS